VTELTATQEDYLEAIFRVEMQRGKVRVKDIANLLNVKMPSVTSALQTLQGQGVIEHEKYGGVHFTAAGRKVARDIYRRHQVLREFLADILQLPAKAAEEQACEMEHALNPETLKRLLAMLDFIKRCPRGGADWLEHLKGRWEGEACAGDCAACIAAIQPPEGSPFATGEGQGDTITLDRLEPGQRGVIVRLGGSGAVRRRIMDMGFTPGSDLEVERLAPLGDPMEFKIRGYHLSLRHEEAAKIHVRPT